MIFLFTLFSLALPISAANAVYNNFTPAVKGITIANTHCYFWFHQPIVAAPWDFEAACYQNGVAFKVAADTSGLTADQEVDTPDGVIKWHVAMNPDGKSFDYMLSGQGSDDAQPLTISGTI